jgi:(p)ppGpp synthase/HD superfamily hydrolase
VNISGGPIGRLHGQQIIIQIALSEETVATLERAIQIAVEAHSGQTDKAGNPYILHPLRIMFRMRTDDEKITAVLHDVVEDSPWTLEGLRDEGFSETVLEAVRYMTRASEDSYETFIEIAMSNPISCQVKLEDIRDNLDLSRLSEVNDRDIVRIRKYLSALRAAKLRDAG